VLWLASVNSTSDEDLASLKNNAVAKLSLFCKNQTLLDIALTHKSLISEGNLSMEETGSVTNERLEFLGDSVLSLVISTYRYGLYEDFPEGDLTRVRSQTVRT
jgi:ribonuclease-3